MQMYQDTLQHQSFSSYFLICINVPLILFWILKVVGHSISDISLHILSALNATPTPAYTI